MRVVFDTNVFVSALVGGGPPWELLERWTRSDAFELIVSPMLLEELSDVLRRDKFRRWFTLEDAEILISRLRSEATEVKDPDTAEPVTADPDDDYLVALAIAAEADGIVSGDSDFTAMPNARPTVYTPTDFLGALKAPA